MSGYRINLSFDAYTAIRNLDVDNEQHHEVGAVLVGSIDHQRRWIRVSDVIANGSSTPRGRTHTGIDFDRALALEKYADDGTVLRGVVGDAHSHVEPGLARASDQDRQAWQQAAKGLGAPYAGLILSADDELWQGGYPSDLPDWDTLRISAFVTDKDGRVQQTTWIRQPEWLRDLEARTQLRQKETT